MVRKHLKDRRRRRPLTMLDAVAYVVPIAMAMIVIFLVTDNRLVIGIGLLGLSILAPLVYRSRGGDIESMLADIVYGMMDVGGTIAFAALGGIVGGVVGVLFGTIAGDALFNSFSGMMEGRVAQWLRQRGVEEARNPVVTGLGKMTGGLVSAGFVLTVIGIALG